MTFPVMLLFFIGGAVVGSFLNVCIYRLPKNESIISPGSHCPHCNTPLKFYHNIPVLSYLFLKGKCAYCGGTISARYMWIELLSAFLSVVIYLKFRISAETIFYLFLVYILIVISFIDIDTQLIKNKVLVILAAGGLTINLGLQIIPWPDVLFGALAGGGMLFFFAQFGRWYFKKESMGMGDVKFAAVLGLFLGWKIVLVSLYAGYFFSAIYLISLKLFKKQPIQSYVPMGPFFALGALVLILWHQELFDLYISLIT